MFEHIKPVYHVLITYKNKSFLLKTILFNEIITSLNR